MEDSIRQFVVGPIETNCYAYISEGQCMVVDPGSQGSDIAQALVDTPVKLIVATHGHPDHIGGVARLKEATGAQFALSEKDAYRVSLEGSRPTSINVAAGDGPAPQPDIFLHEGDELRVGSARFRVLETPGHTQGCVCLLGQGSAEGLVFVGDTLFAGSAGRTDLEGGDFSQLMQSLERLKSELDPSVLILSGHGSATTMEQELATNRFLTTDFSSDPRYGSQ